MLFEVDSALLSAMLHGSLPQGEWRDERGVNLLDSFAHSHANSGWRIVRRASTSG